MVMDPKILSARRSPSQLSGSLFGSLEEERLGHGKKRGRKGRESSAEEGTVLLPVPAPVPQAQWKAITVQTINLWE